MTIKHSIDSSTLPHAKPEVPVEPSAKRRSLVALLFGGAATLSAVGALLFFLASAWQVDRHRKWLASIGAKCYWQHEVFDVRSMEIPIVRQKLAAFINPALVSNLAVVQIDSGDLGDAQLSRLSELQRLITLKVVSQDATDATLTAIARIEKLRHLDLSGMQFSFQGLLQLRALQQLDFLSLADMQLSSAELAVIESALPNTEIVYRNPTRGVVYHRVPAMARKTNIRYHSTISQSGDVVGI